MVTVLISTADRPAFLRTALASVARQTARARIAKVVVSETAFGTQSEGVCAEFTTLPLVFLFQDPPLDSLSRLPTLLAEAETPHVAILHDDDWWHPDHLANGLRCLDEGGPEATYWCSYFRVSGESSWLSHWSSSLWLGSGYQPLTEIWKLDLKQNILGCICCTPCHYSSLITNTRTLMGCCDAVTAQKNIFDNDRIIVTELAKRGITYFNPIPEVFIRYHNLTDTLNFSLSTRAAWFEATTNYLLDECEALGFNVQTELETLLANCAPESRNFVYNDFQDGSITALMKRNKIPPTLARHLIRRRIKGYIKTVLPPFVTRGLVSLAASRLKNKSQ